MIASGHAWSYLWLLAKGLLVTLELSFFALLLGSAVGLVLGLMRSSPRWWIGVLPFLYIELIRSTPFLILLFFIYYGMPLALDTDIPAYPAAIWALSLHCSGYMAEVVRAGVLSVPRGQWEAAYALGLRYPRVMWQIVLPQAMRVTIPPTIGVYVSTIKESALASVIGFVELLGTGMAIRDSNTGRNTGDVLLAVAVFYFVVCFALSRVGRILELRTSRDLHIRVSVDAASLGAAD